MTAGQTHKVVTDSGAPSLDIDLFSEASLRNPFDDYRRLRDTGPVVWLSKIGIYAIGRFADAQKALRASDELISGEGVGFNDIFNAPKGMNVIQSDGDIHNRMRNTVMKPLTPAALREVRPRLKAMIVDQLQRFSKDVSFDAMKDIAPVLPVGAISHLVGIPDEGRERMLEWAAAAFNAIGPTPDADDAALLREAFAFISSMDENKVAEGSWSAGLFAAADKGKISRQEAVAAMSAYVVPSLDTTILASGHLLYNLATHGDQWDMVRENPDLIPSAVLENMRHSAPARWFSRVAAKEYAVDGMSIPKGARVMILYGCANRDERRFENPDRFDVTRDARDHLGWGTGPHMCAGMHLARMEMEVLLEALVEADVRLEAGEPVLAANAGLYGFAELPLRLIRNG